MNIDEAIKNLEDAKKAGKKNIILAWWDNEAFGYKDNDEWAALCDAVDDKMDWSNSHDDLTSFLEYAEGQIDA